MDYRTIVVSDVHIGTKDSKVKELTQFLKENTCEKLILNGDIIDGWNLKRRGKWKKKDTKFFRLLLKLSNKTEIIYIRGNHDDFLENILPFKLGNFSIRDSYIYYSNNKKYLIIHGDVFDLISNKYKWIAKIGSLGYDFLLWLNRIYNKRRLKKGKDYFSLSKKIKKNVKFAVKYISNFEDEMVDYCKSKNYDGIISGHIHHPEIRKINKIKYLNSGDWVESLTALVETKKGKWKIKFF